MEIESAHIATTGGCCKYQLSRRIEGKTLDAITAVCEYSAWKFGRVKVSQFHAVVAHGRLQGRAPQLGARAPKWKMGLKLIRYPSESVTLAHPLAPQFTMIRSFSDADELP